MKFLFYFSNLLFFCAILNFQSTTSAYVVGETCGKIVDNLGSIGNAVYPWFAVLSTTNGRQFCGGTVLTKNKILTAASCIHGKDNLYKFTATDIIVTLGARNLSASIERGRITVDVERIDVHPDWNVSSMSFDADMAVLTLTHDVNFNRFIKPICMTDSNSEIMKITQGHSISYGLHSYDDNKNELNPITIPIENRNEYCFYTNYELVQFSSPRTFCGGYRNGSGVCMGDGGNGLFVIYDNMYYLRGIVSATLVSGGGCDLFSYAIFTDVPKFYSWINSKINDLTVQTTTIATTTYRSKWQQYFANQGSLETTTRMTYRTTRRTTPTSTTTPSPEYNQNANEDVSCASKWYRFCP
ncbi:serine protease gd-like [Chironomus tepperi]|uniref:serine protease gd-like n=1 Tax=Chironomus tepperi TaxID=113505 RepID=UPI00391FB377